MKENIRKLNHKLLSFWLCRLHNLVVNRNAVLKGDRWIEKILRV